MVSAEPAPFTPESLDALDIWEMMGCELRLEVLPVILALHPECDPHMTIELLTIIDKTLRKKT